MTQNNTGAPSLNLFFETTNAYQRTAVLQAAVDLELFTAIAEGANTADAAAKRCKASQKGIRVLCDSLTIMGFLTKNAGGYALTADSALFLDKRSPAYVGGSLEFLLDSTLMENFKDLASVVRKGGPVIHEQGTVEPDHPVWVKFARGMAPLMAMPSEIFAGLLTSGTKDKWKVMDIAAGHGLYGIAIAKQNPNAHIYAVDWAAVLAVAEENAAATGISDRFHKITGSAFDVEFGSDFDLVLLPNFLHHFDIATCTKLLMKVHKALKPGGRVAILEFVPNEDRVTPALPAMFSLMMLSGTPSGDAYTYAQIESMLKAAGFKDSSLHPMPPTMFTAVVAKK